MWGGGINSSLIDRKCLLPTQALSELPGSDFYTPLEEKLRPFSDKKEERKQKEEKKRKIIHLQKGEKVTYCSRKRWGRKQLFVSI